MEHMLFQMMDKESFLACLLLAWRDLRLVSGQTQNFSRSFLLEYASAWPQQGLISFPLCMRGEAALLPECHTQHVLLPGRHLLHSPGNRAALRDCTQSAWWACSQ